MPGCGWGWDAPRAGQAGELRAGVTQMALPPSGCTLKLQSWSVLCWGKDEKPFQKGCVAQTPACYCALWTPQPKSGLNWASPHFVLFCRIDMPSVYKCHDCLAKQKIYFSSALSVSVFEVYLPRLQYIKHWEMGISRVQFRALKLAPALNCPLKVPVSFYWLQKVLTETSFLCLKLAFVKTLLCISYCCSLYWNGSI